MRTEHAAQTRERATQKVLTGPLPVAADAEPKLRAELESMAAPDPAALRELQRRIESALQRVRQDEELAQGLLDRRTELKGRLKAYEAKAARLGLAEDPDLLSSRRIASGLLSRQPCDLRAVTQAIVDYQQMLADEAGEDTMTCLESGCSGTVVDGYCDVCGTAPDTDRRRAC